MPDNARRVLGIYAHFKSKAGDALLANHFLAIGQSRGWRSRELQDEIEFARERGWIEEAPLGWRLTVDGYREAGMLRASSAHAAE